MKKYYLVTYTQENWQDYAEAKFHTMKEAIDFSNLLIYKFQNYSIFSVETITK